MNLNSRLVLIVCILLHSCLAQEPQVNFDSSLSDEFVGPFEEWLNIKEDFGAHGDGTSDDAPAFKAAFDLMANNKNINLWIPAGNYAIQTPLRLVGFSAGSMIGEDPLTTTIFYNGDDCLDETNLNCVLFTTSGSSGFAVGRITWDGKNKIATLVNNYYDSKEGSYSAQGKHFDSIYKNAQFGIRVGFGCRAFCPSAEWVVYRCRFQDLSKAGWRVEEWNSLDWILRYNVFERCYNGIAQLQGNFYSSDNVFLNSMGSDYNTTNSIFASARNSFSYGSNAYFWTTYAEGSYSQYSIQRNTIIRTGATHLFNVEDLGPFFLVDNTIVYTDPNYQGYAVLLHKFGNQKIAVGVGNTYVNVQQNKTYVADIESSTIKTIISINDTWVSTTTPSSYWKNPTLPGFQARTSRRIFIATPANFKEVIQEASNVSQNSPTLLRPIVHFSPGRYIFTETIVLPPYCDIQFVGNYGSFYWPWDQTTFNTTVWTYENDYRGPYFEIQGPSRVTFQHIMIYSLDWAGKDGFLFTNVDTPGSRILTEDTNWSENCGTDYILDGVDYLRVDMDATWAAGTHRECSNSTRPVAVVANRGGVCMQEGHSSGTAAVNSYGGLVIGGAVGSGSLWEVKDNAHVMILDNWYEGTQTGLIKWTDGQKGTFTWSDGIISPYMAESPEKENDIRPSVQLDNFTGKATFFAGVIRWGYESEKTVTNSNANTNVLFFGISSQNPDPIKAPGINFTYVLPPNGNNAYKLLLHDWTQSDINTGPLSSTDSWVLSMLEQLRDTKNQMKMPTPFNDKRDGVTDVRFYRNSFWRTNTGIKVVGANIGKSTCPAPLPPITGSTTSTTSTNSAPNSDTADDDGNTGTLTEVTITFVAFMLLLVSFF